MRIVVTGGAGFIGSHLVDALVLAGHEVLVLDSLWRPGGGRRDHVASSAEFVEMDIRDERVAGVLDRFKPEVVYHLAAQQSVVAGVRNPRHDAGVNVLGFLNILDAACSVGVRKVVFASSAATYGNVEELPVNEDSLQRPLSPYGMTKMIGEQYLGFYRKHHGLASSILRYGNVYGPRQSLLGDVGLIARFTSSFAARQAIRVEGDGEQTRDYVFVSDVVRANVAVLVNGTDKTYVIGSGTSTSVNEVYDQLVALTGFRPMLMRCASRSGDARAMVFDVGKARRELHWSVDVSLSDGLRATYAFFDLERRKLIA